MLATHSAELLLFYCCSFHLCIMYVRLTRPGQTALSFTLSHRVSSCCCVAGASGKFLTLYAHSTTGLSAAASAGVSSEHGSGGTASAAAAASESSLLLLGLPPAGGAAAGAAEHAELAVLPAALGSAGGSGIATLKSCRKQEPQCTDGTTSKVRQRTALHADAQQCVMSISAYSR